MPIVLNSPIINKYLKVAEEGKNSIPSIIYPELSPEHSKEVIRKWNKQKKLISKLIEEADARDSEPEIIWIK